MIRICCLLVTLVALTVREADSFCPKKVHSVRAQSAQTHTRETHLSFWKNAQPSVETEEERKTRLALERLEKLEIAEVSRQEQVKEDAIPYLFLLALQALPLLGQDRYLSLLYFFGVATTTVYLGGRQKTVGDPDIVSAKSALAAPIAGSVSIFALYLMLNAGFDPTVLYAVGVTIFGALSISDIGVPILRNLLPQSFAEAKVTVPKPIAEKLDLNPPELPVDGLVALGLGVLCSLFYWAPVAMTQKFIISNGIAWAIGMASLGAISLGSFQTGALLLMGLFFYDIFWVFGTDVMMTVATKVEAPIKFLFSVDTSSDPDRYPFSVLGLGDVVIPGLFVRFMSRVDEVLNPARFSYFKAGSAAYAVGLGVCFLANALTEAGQPALLYLDPACVGSAVAVAAANGQLEGLWNINFENKEE